MLVFMAAIEELFYCGAAIEEPQALLYDPRSMLNVSQFSTFLLLFYSHVSLYFYSVSDKINVERKSIFYVSASVL